MKLIVDKGSNGLTTKEFTEYLKTPTPKIRNNTTRI